MKSHLIKMRQCLAILLLLPSVGYSKPILNIFIFGSEIPMSLIWKFEKETGIVVNYSTYDSNETMYAKLRANKKNFYDIVMPSGYYIERMKKQNLLTKVDKSQLPNLKNLDPLFTNNGFDSGNQYSIPMTWGTTGIFYNDYWIKNPPTSFNMLWESRWKNKLLLLDDVYDVFSVALLSLGFSPNAGDPKQIAIAYQKLLTLIPNIKLFSTDTIRSTMIDEDVEIGISWNGDVAKSIPENRRLRYVYPREGFIIWVDCLAIPKHAPHLKEAYQFINFLLDPKNSSELTLQMGYAITNQVGKELLPIELKNNPVIFPSQETLKRGIFQRDVGEEAIELYSEYWEKLKLAF